MGFCELPGELVVMVVESVTLESFGSLWLAVYGLNKRLLDLLECTRIHKLVVKIFESTYLGGPSYFASKQTAYKRDVFYIFFNSYKVWDQVLENDMRKINMSLGVGRGFWGDPVKEITYEVGACGLSDLDFYKYILRYTSEHGSTIDFDNIRKCTRSAIHYYWYRVRVEGYQIVGGYHTVAKYCLLWKFLKWRFGRGLKFRGWCALYKNLHGSKMIQALLFDGSIWKAPGARRWMKDHDYKPIKRVHKTENYLRYRLSEPDSSKTYRTIDFGDSGIKAVMEYDS